MLNLFLARIDLTDPYKEIYIGEEQDMDQFATWTK
jgi:hypothetical protein